MGLLVLAMYVSINNHLSDTQCVLVRKEAALGIIGGPLPEGSAATSQELFYVTAGV